MKIKAGDIIEFIALEWHESHWEFDHPTVVLKPIISYSPNGTSPESMIDDLCSDLCISADDVDQKEIIDENVSQEFNWRKWDLKRMNIVAKNRLNSRDDWKSKYAKVVKYKVEFFTNPSNETDYKVVESFCH